MKHMNTINNTINDRIKRYTKRILFGLLIILSLIAYDKYLQNKIRDKYPSTPSEDLLQLQEMKDFHSNQGRTNLIYSE